MRKATKEPTKLCGAIQRQMDRRPIIGSWVKLWPPLLRKIDFNVQEAHHLTFWIRLAENSPDVHTGWKDNRRITTTIREVWVGAREVFGKQWRKNTLITEADTWNNKEDLNSQTLLAPTKKLCFKKVGIYSNRPNKVEERKLNLRKPPLILGFATWHLKHTCRSYYPSPSNIPTNTEQRKQNHWK